MKTMIRPPSGPPEPMAPRTGQALSWHGLRFETDGWTGQVVSDTLDFVELSIGRTHHYWTRRAFADALITGQVTWL